MTAAANRGPDSFITIGCGGIRRRPAAVPPAAAGLRTAIRGGWRVENAVASAVKGSRLKVIFLDSARSEAQIYLFHDFFGDREGSKEFYFKCMCGQSKGRITLFCNLVKSKKT